MAALIIGTTEQAQIDKLVAYAKTNPIPLDVIRAGAVPDTEMVRLQDRKPGFERPASQHVVLPGGFRAAFSIEQQPAGYCSHLSISVMGRAKKGAMPHPMAVAMICEALLSILEPDQDAA